MITLGVSRIVGGVAVGLDTDEATIAAVRSVTKKPLRVDANEGWKTKEEAARKGTALCASNSSTSFSPSSARSFSGGESSSPQLSLALEFSEA